MSLRSSIQQPPVICQMRSAAAANRTLHIGQRWAKYGPRDDFMRPAGSYKKMNRSTEDAKTFSFAPYLYFRRTQDIQRKTGYARI